MHMMKQKSLKFGTTLEHSKHETPLNLASKVELQMNQIVKHKKTLLIEESVSMILVNFHLACNNHILLNC